MKVAALVLGILSGLSGLNLAFFGHVALSLVATGGLKALGTFLLFGLAIASFVGGGMSLSSPRQGGVILLVTSVGWFLLGAAFGYGINFITLSTIVLSAAGGGLALLAASQDASLTTSKNGFVERETAGARTLTEAAWPAIAMPQSVVLFERLAYAALTFEVLAILIDPLNREAWGLAGSVLVAAIAILITSLVVWAAARRRKNWARWVYLVLGVIGMASTIWSFTDEGQSMLVHVLNVAADLCFLAAAYHAFMEESRPWFHPIAAGEGPSSPPLS